MNIIDIFGMWKIQITYSKRNSEHQELNGEHLPFGSQTWLARKSANQKNEPTMDIMDIYIYTHIYI